MLTKKCSISVFALESGTSKGSELMTQIDPKYVCISDLIDHSGTIYLRPFNSIPVWQP